MDNYSIKITPSAYQDLENLYNYIVNSYDNNKIADKVINELETAIFSLNFLPYRGSIRKIGIYANKGYRQIFNKHYIIVYRIIESTKTVLIVSIKHTAQKF